MRQTRTTIILLISCLIAEVPSAAFVGATIGPRPDRTEATSRSGGSLFQQQALMLRQVAEEHPTDPAARLFYCQKGLFIISATRAQPRRNDIRDLRTFARRLPEDYREFQHPLLRTYISELNELLAQIPGYWLIANPRSRIRISQDLIETEEDQAAEPHLFFSGRWRRARLVVDRFGYNLDHRVQNRRPEETPEEAIEDLRTQDRFFIVHDYGHVGDANGAIGPRSRRQLASLQRTRNALLRKIRDYARHAPLQAEQADALLRGREDDIRAEIFRDALLPLRLSHPYAAWLMEVRYARLEDHPAIYRRFAALKFTNLGSAIVVAADMELWEADGDRERAQYVRQRFIEASRIIDPLLYDITLSLIDYLREYRQAFVYDPSWLQKFGMKIPVARPIEWSPSAVRRFASVRAAGPGQDVLKAFQRSPKGVEGLARAAANRAKIALKTVISLSGYTSIVDWKLEFAEDVKVSLHWDESGWVEIRARGRSEAQTDALVRELKAKLTQRLARPARSLSRQKGQAESIVSRPGDRIDRRTFDFIRGHRGQSLGVRTNRASGELERLAGFVGALAECEVAEWEYIARERDIVFYFIDGSTAVLGVSGDGEIEISASARTKSVAEALTDAMWAAYSIFRDRQDLWREIEQTLEHQLGNSVELIRAADHIERHWGPLDTFGGVPGFVEYLFDQIRSGLESRGPLTPVPAREQLVETGRQRMLAGKRFRRDA